MLFLKKVVERIQEPNVEPIEVLAQEHSAVTSLVNPQISITADDASQVVGSFSLSEEFAVPALVTTSTSTSSSSTSTTSNAIAVMLDNLKNIEKEVERAAMLTKRMMETPLPEPPLPEPPVVEPPMVEPDRTSPKRHRRTSYTPLPGIMEHAVYLAPSAWPPIQHA